ncbi:MAG: hypothetical protein IRZ11_00505 [Clostridia bacterium]|nr:hypothetical protein [Clostridia bacterium]
MREVRVRIGKGGRVETDFHGFLDDDCLEEADRLAALLSGLGLEMNLRERAMKTMAARLGEAGVDAGEVGAKPQEGTRAREGRVGG